MKNVLVTGTSGFVGSRLSSNLRDLDLQIVGIDDEYFDSVDWKKTLISSLDTINPEVVFQVVACSDTLEQNVQFMM